MVNIKVAVRIRPLSERELRNGEKVIVRKDNKSVLVTNPKIPERQDGDSRQRTRRFTVDFCYDSNDPEGSSQEAVYKEIGFEVVHSMYEGYNACVLAYGHSASGKTYTIMGVQSDPGLTPRLCEGLFDKVKEDFPEGRIRVQIVISFLEIYNEKVRDLLGSEETGAAGGNFSLRVREHPKLGPYVQGLSEHSVTDKRELLQLLATGNRRRSTAATESNVHSSRSHALFTILLKQSDGEKFETEKSSKVHLVDLAGSERARASQSKARLQEGANINKSLATLGNVICALAESYDSGTLVKEHSTSKTWQPFVPYRDSVLTWLLKDTLGGNSNTIMIATISPASSCISETVNTLRYAKRAKKIVNQPIVNEDPKIRTIRELRKEIARLKGLLIFFRSCGRVADPWDRHLDKATEFLLAESKWQEPEGTQITIKEGSHWKKEISGLKSGKKEEEEGEVVEEEDKNKEEEVSEGPKSSKEGESGVRREGTAVRCGDACEIGDEKKSDVNGSVNDISSHETHFFSDSLESFSSVFPKSGNSCDADDDGWGQPGEDDHGLGKRAFDAHILSFSLCSDENLAKTAFPEMLHRSRPDLIKGIATRTQENGLPLGSSHSCTDVSNLSHSTSENSLNSSGSAEVQPSENRPQPKPRPYNLGARTEKRERGTGKNGTRNEVLEPKKKEKRLEAAEAVTSRLYGVKKKVDNKTEVVKREENEDDLGELEELKLCKRARMKLFDISRKLAMSRKMKKTVDSDTQTESVQGTLRVKEKCVTTDLSGAATPEAATSENIAQEDKKPYVIMNQVFIPRASNYVVECGKVVRVEGPEVLARQESATQTSKADKRYKNADTSPIEFSSSEEDCFSEDSLDTEVKRPSCRDVMSREEQTSGRLTPETRIKSNWTPGFEVVLPREPEARLAEESRAQSGREASKSVEAGNVLFNGLVLPVFMEQRTDSADQLGFFIVQPPSGVRESRKGENISSENSFTSTESTENNSLSEASSEDFVFYENPKDLPNKSKGTSDRELYTITENSEQSDPSDAFSPVQRQRSYKVQENEGELKEWTENPMRRLGGNKSVNDSMKDLETLGEERESSPKYGKPHSRDAATGISGDTVLHHFHLIPKMTPDSLKVPKQTSPSDAYPKATQRLPNTKAAYRCGENLAEGREFDKTDVPFCPSDGEGRAKRMYRTEFKPQKQYLNLNISNSNGNNSRAPPFSVDTHLFGKASKGDHSTDTMSTSADSITFVFMGPAKPKTSVLMEIIGRSLGRSSHSEAHRKSRSRGVQCDASLMRSVSVDTAMIALSRIARNQEGSPEMQRTTSLGKLDPDDMFGVLGGGNLQSQPGSTCQCRLQTGNLKEEKKKCVVQHSVGTSTCCDNQEVDNSTKNKTVEAEKPKKSVSWFGETGREEVRMHYSSGRDTSLQSEQPDFGEFRNCQKTGTDKLNDLKLSPTIDSDLPERRVRFQKQENTDFGETEFGQRKESVADLAAFLKEATQLLKNINSRSSKQVFSEEAVEEFGADKKSGFKTSKKTEGVTRTSFLEKDPGWRWKGTVGVSGRKDENQVNLTWPRRRPTTGKPPTGTRSRFPRSPLPSSLHSNAFPNSTSNLRSCSQSSRVGSNGQSWNLSNLSVALGNSCFGETDSRPPSSRSSYCNEVNMHRDFGSSPVNSPKRMVHPRLNVDSISDLETDLEECCRRLEMATEQDKARGKRKVFEWRRDEEGYSTGNEDVGRKQDVKPETPRGVLNRRRTEGCAGGCVCEAPGREPCRHLWSRGCRSTFELDTFGPGSRHCPQLCMFCRKKEAEVYYSAVSLNSECSSDLCRLNYYGFCPCSPVKLNQVVLSPRAYMQRLLALRKQIVSDTKLFKLDEFQYGDSLGLSRRGRSALSAGQDFS